MLQENFESWESESEKFLNLITLDKIKIKFAEYRGVSFNIVNYLLLGVSVVPRYALQHFLKSKSHKIAYDLSTH